MSDHWCDECGGSVLDLGADGLAHVCLPEQADGFTLANRFYRFDRKMHVWMMRVPCVEGSEILYCWELAELPADVLTEVAHMRHQLIS